MMPACEPLLRISLEAAVPLWVEEWRRLGPGGAEERAAECARVVAEKGDVLQYRGKKRGESAAAFNALAEGLALLSFAPGGVTFLGLQWESHWVT